MSTIKVDELQFTSGVRQYTAKAWVNIWGTNGAGASVASSGNVSSITDDGVALYTANFANAMSNVYYSTTMAYTDESSSGHTVGFIVNGFVLSRLYSTTQCRTGYWNTGNSGARVDKGSVCLSFFE